MLAGILAGTHSEPADIPNLHAQLPVDRVAPRPQDTVPVRGTPTASEAADRERRADLQPPPTNHQPEAAAFDEVARSLAAAEACVPLLAQATGLMRLAALDVVKAETARAGGLLQLLRFVRGDVVPSESTVSTNAVLQRVIQSAEAERRLRGIAMTSRSSHANGDALVSGDEALLSNALLALTLATFALLDGVQDAQVTLSVDVSDAGEVALSVSQDQASAPAGWMARDEADQTTSDSAGVVAGVARHASLQLARAWGGEFTVSSAERSTICTVWLPGVQPPAAS